MSREDYLAYEPFLFEIHTGVEKYYLAAPIKVEGWLKNEEAPTAFADGHEEGGLRITEELEIEGIMPRDANDPRLMAASQYKDPKILCQTFRNFLEEGRELMIYCPYLAVSDVYVLKSFAWNPVPEGDGEIHYTVRFAREAGALEISA